jgi:hypothetical protein
VEEEEVEKKIDVIFPNCCIRGVSLKQMGGRRGWQECCGMWILFFWNPDPDSTYQ